MIHSRGFKWGAVVWALLIGIALILLAGSVMLPSTKRARVDLDELRRQQDQEQASAETNAPPATFHSTKHITLDLDGQKVLYNDESEAPEASSPTPPADNLEQ